MNLDHLEEVTAEFVRLFGDVAAHIMIEHIQVLCSNRNKGLCGEDDYIKFILSYNFMRYLKTCPLEKFKELKEDPENLFKLCSKLKIAPAGFFLSKMLITQRMYNFLENLCRGDILDLQVKIVSPEVYNLIILNKEQSFQKIDDLCMLAYLRRNKKTEYVLSKALGVDELVRGVVTDCDRSTCKIIIDVDEDKLPEDKIHVKLGRISSNDLPYFLSPDFKPVPYDKIDLATSHLIAKYLGCEPQTKLLPQLPRTMSEEGKKRASNLYLQKAKNIPSENFVEILDLLDEALKLWPGNALALELRSSIFYKQGEKRKALYDNLDALRLNVDSVEAKRFIINTSIFQAKKFIICGNVETARVILMYAIAVGNGSPEAEDAAELLAALNEHHPADPSVLQEQPLETLWVIKNSLKAELKEFSK